MLIHMDDRIAMFIDIRGFGQLYGHPKADSLWGLADLMQGVYRIGAESTRLGFGELFAHQFGDGFVLISNGDPTNVNRFVAAAVALHQFTLMSSGHFCTSAIDRGGLADVVGCYSPIVMNARQRDGVVRMGDGLMTYTPVMGTAVINTYRRVSQIHGPFIVLPEAQGTGLEPGIIRITERGMLFVDWFSSESDFIAAAREILGLSKLSRASLAAQFDASVVRNEWRPEWTTEAARFLRRE